MYLTEKANGKWRVVNEVGQIVVTIEPPAGNDQEDCGNLAKHIASFMNQIVQWTEE